MFDNLKEDLKETREKKKNGTIGEFEYEPSEGDRDRRYEYRVEKLGIDHQHPQDFLNYLAADGWQLVERIDGDYLWTMGPGSDREVALVFERPVEGKSPSESHQDDG